MPRDTIARDKPRESSGESATGISAGWSVDKRPRVVKGDKPTRFTVPDDGAEVIIKFLEDRPFAPIFQHWVMTKEGRRAYTCLGDECPLCARGDRAKSSDWFNVVVMPNDEIKVTEPTLMLWYATADPSAAIKERADNRRTSPINKEGLYFAISKRPGKNGFNSYTVDAVKEDELDEWGITPLTEAELEKFAENAYTAALVRQSTKSELLEIANKLED